MCCRPKSSGVKVINRASPAHLPVTSKVTRQVPGPAGTLTSSPRTCRRVTSNASDAAAKPMAVMMERVVRDIFSILCSGRIYAEENDRFCCFQLEFIGEPGCVKHPEKPFSDSLFTPGDYATRLAKKRYGIQ